MKEIVTNANALLTAFFATKSRKPAVAPPQSLLMHSLLRNRKPEMLSGRQPAYRSVTALIH